MRIQFDIDGEWEERFRELIPGEKARHIKAEEALQEWIRRMEARDQRVTIEREKRIKKIIKPILLELLEVMQRDK
jgi:hypothetical protein